MLELCGEWDVVCGIRRDRRDSRLKKVSSRIANSIRNRLTGDTIEDVGCSLRIIRAELLASMPLFSGMHRFLPTLLRNAGGRVIQVPVGHRARLHGESKYGLGNRFWHGLIDLFGVRWLQRRQIDTRRVEEITKCSTVARFRAP